MRLTRRRGDGLVGVRYRHNGSGTYRYMTVKMLVDEAFLVSRKADQVIVGVRFDATEGEMR